jgi:PEP-CTERM motif
MVSLQIAPEAGAIGTVTFATPTTSATATEPSNYVFAVPANAGLNVTNSSSSMFFYDYNSPFSGGIDVPQSPGKNLLTMTFNATAGASGKFDVVALPGSANTEWTDNTQPTQLGHAFLNVPAGSPVVIGQILVALSGDFNGNGVVDAADYVLWRETLGQTGASLPADGDHNGTVDNNDYSVWRANFGAGGLGAGSLLGTTSVPEPSTVFLLFISALTFTARRRARPAV